MICAYRRDPRSRNAEATTQNNIPIARNHLNGGRVSAPLILKELPDA